MHYLADLHIHSHYSIATSKESDPEHIFEAAALKGINLVGTGDLTHPGWRKELEEKLVFDDNSGFHRLRPDLERQIRSSLPGTTRNITILFVLSGEISSIYKKMGRARKVHNLILLPDFASAGRLCSRLEKIGNIHSDGRPILGLDSRDLLEICLEASPQAIFIPAHIWTPHFSVFGSKSGFDRIEDCYGDLTGQIHAVETGLSSDPQMNWRLSALDNFVLVSNSDAHSPDKLGREANLLNTELNYGGLSGALQKGDSSGFAGTIEFYPEEGKYHYDGHRACKVRLNPEETHSLAGRCPVCGGKVTEGVLNRVIQLADRPAGVRPEVARHFERLIPLREVVAESLGTTPQVKAVSQNLHLLLRELGPELYVLREALVEEINRVAGPFLAEAVKRNREGRVKIEPGYDGEYGTVRIFEPGEREASGGQMFFAGDFGPEKKPAKTKAERHFSSPVLDKTARDSTVASPDTKTASSGLFDLNADILTGLNPGQLEAVTLESGPLAVVAGPGTGKTRCLAARAAYLVLRNGVSPENILAVTFTNKAAREIEERLARIPAAGKDGAGRVRASTFHSFCLRLLTEIRGSVPVIIDEVEGMGILRDSLGSKEPASLLREIVEAIGRAKARLIAPENYRGPEGIRRAYTSYRDFCRKTDVLDYDDLILETVELLKKDPDKLSVVRVSYPYLLVDEFQDINPAQYELIRLLAGPTGEGLFVIGDPNQSIYGFRGSDHRIFDRLRQDYERLRLFTLETGYRCPQVITEASAAIMEKSAGSGVIPLPITGGGSLIRLIRCPGEQSEAIAVVREIGRLVGGIGMLSAHGEMQPRPDREDEIDQLYSFADCAVIARTGAICEALEEAFDVEGIPCRLRGNKSFLEDHDVRKLLPFVHLAANPQDDLRFSGALRLAGLNPSAEYFAALIDTAARSGRNLISELKYRLSREVPLSLMGNRAAGFLLTLEKFRRQSGQPPGEFLRAVAAEFLPGRTETEGISTLLRTAEQFGSLKEFLDLLGTYAYGDIERRSRKNLENRSEAVTLMTMHASKGLEFKVVFICGFEEGIIPYTYRESDPDEERRLFYVALTRAAERLYLTAAARRKIRGKMISSPCSPFLKDIPPRLIKEVDAVFSKKTDRQLGLLC
jgi:uncharacterized protein (TIGR00375 family)